MNETTKSALARELGVSHVRIQQYLKAGMPQLPNGKLNRLEALLWIVANVAPDDDNSKSGKKAAELLSDATGKPYKQLTQQPGMNDHKMRLLKARADVAEMEAATLAGRLVEVEEVETVWANAAALMRQRMLSVAPKAAPMVAVETSADACHEIIEGFIHEALAELADVHVSEIDAAESVSQ